MEQQGGGLRQGALRAEEALQDGVALNRPRARLVERLRGMAAKAGKPATTVALLQRLDEDRIQAWLRLQRDGHDKRLFAELADFLTGFLDISPTELGAALAVKVEPKAPPPARRTPPASGTFRPLAAVMMPGAAASPAPGTTFRPLGSVAMPSVLKRPSDAEMRASVARLNALVGARP
jgi:hypothetical protein